MHSANSSIARAIGLVLASTCASQALAVNVSNYNESSQITLFISGPLTTNGLITRTLRIDATAAGICQSNTLDVYVSQDGLKSLYLCTGRSGGTPVLPPSLQGTRIAIHKSVGSGVYPLVRNVGTGLPDYWNVVTGGGFLTACVGSLQPASGPLSAYTLHAICSNSPIQARVTEVGISDLEPAMFKDQVPAGQSPMNGQELAAIPGNAIFASVSAPAVSLNVRDNMQRIEFSSSSPCHPDNAGYAAADETEACAPSLTRPQLAALYSQNYLDWFQLQGDELGESVASPDSFGTRDLANGGEVFICRRTSGSATQTVFETQLFGQRCVSGAASFATAASDIFLPDVHVTEGLGSANVVNCLASANAAGRGAIGTISAEIAPDTSRGPTDSGFRLLKMDGVAPCLLPVVQSKYNFYGESTMQWRTSTINGLSALAGTGLTLAQALRDRIGSPLVLGAPFSTIAHPMCAALGDSARVSSARYSAFGPSPPFVVGGDGSGDVTVHPVLTKIRSINGQNSCLPTIDILPTQMTN